MSSLFFFLVLILPVKILIFGKFLSYFFCLQLWHIYIYRYDSSLYTSLDHSFLLRWFQIGPESTWKTYGALLIWLYLKVTHAYPHPYIYIYIYIIMSRYQHRYSWPSRATPAYRPLLPAGLQDYIPYRHRAAVCRFNQVVLPLLGHVKGSTGVHHLWARPNFSSSVPHDVRFV